MEKIPIKKIRAFFALKIPDELKKELSRIQQQIEAISPRVLHFISPEQMHITLAFMGRISDISRQRAIGAVQIIANHTLPLELRPTALGALPRIARPAVIYLGVSDREHKLLKLIQLIEHELSAISLTPIRGAGGIVPHISLGRVNRKTRTFRLEALRDFLNENQIDLSRIKFTPEAITTYTTDLNTTGSRYNQVATIPFLKKN